MKKIFLSILLFPVFVLSASYPVPLPSTSNNIMTSTGKKWVSGGPLTTKGDLFTYSTANTRVGVGGHGTVLSSDTAEVTGLKWIANSPTLPLTTKGDILVYSSSNDRQAVGTHNYFLTSDTAQATGLSYLSPGTTSISTTSGAVSADAGVGTYILSAASTITLPAAANNTGKKFNIIDSHATALVVVDGNGAETICGQATITLDGGDSIEIQSDASSWLGNSGGCQRTERLNVASACSSTPCTITTQSGSWASSITRNSEGVYTVNFATGVFSVAPSCSAQPTAGTDAPSMVTDGNVATSTSAFKFNCVQRTATSTVDDCAFMVVCTGPR